MAGASRWLPYLIMLIVLLASPVLVTAQTSREIEDEETADALRGERSDLKGKVIDTVTVTAQKREVDIQRVGVAIEAFTQAQIEELRLRQVSDLSSQASNVNIKQALGGAFPVITIRGVGLNDFNVNNNPTTSVYIDEVFLTSLAQMNFQLFDTERVEVLKGPQGTLYGRNATAGALNLVTRKPTDDFNVRLALGAGNFESFEVEGAVGGRLSDSLSGRFAAFSRQRGEGHFLNRENGDKHGEEDVAAWRGMLDWSPQEDLTVLLKVYGGSDQSDQWYYEHLGFLDPGTLDFCQAFQEGRIDQSTCVDLGGYGDPDSDPFVGDYSFAPVLDKETIGASLTIDWTGAAFDFRSITGYQRVDRLHQEDNDSSPAVGVDIETSNDITQFSQEFRLISNQPVDIGSRGASLDWIVGAYYSVDEVEQAQILSLDDFLFTRASSVYDQDTKAAAFYGHTTWRLTDRFNLIAGLRQTWEEKSFVGGTTDLNPFGASCLLDLFCDPGFVGPVVLASADDEISESDLSGKIGFGFAPNEDWLIYGSAGKGFKSGGFNGGFTASDAELVPVESETIFAYEAGFKSRLAGGRVRFNASAFLYDYEDLQVFAVRDAGGAPTVVLANASDAEVIGAEGELWLRPTGGLDLRLSAGWLDTELTSFRSLGEDLSGNELPNAPRLTYSGLVRYGFVLAQDVAGSVGVHYNWQNDVFKEVTNNPVFIGPGYGLLGARFGVDWPRFGFALWAKNLTDEVHIVDGFDASSLFYGVRVYGMPRTVGVAFTVNR